jgi:putative ABC transport system substrate-binding protein
VKRRTFIAGLGSAVAWPVVARAQQAAVPVIGFLGGGTPGSYASRVAAFHRGLEEAGFVEGRNVLIQYRWVEGKYDRLQGLVIDLIGLRSNGHGGEPVVGGIGGQGGTATIPIVYRGGQDAVDVGLVDSLNRPGGNVTGISALVNALIPKRLQILRALAPRATHIAMLINPDDPSTAAIS